MRKSIVVAGKRMKLDGNRGSVLIKGLGVVSIQVDQFVSLGDFLKIGRTAEEIKKSYGLSSTVAAKRLVKQAQEAGLRISKFTSEEPRAGVGRSPNVYQLSEFVTVPKPAPRVIVVPEPSAPSLLEARMKEARELDEEILKAIKSISTRVAAIEARDLRVAVASNHINPPPASNGHPGR